VGSRNKRGKNLAFGKEYFPKEKKKEAVKSDPTEDCYRFFFCCGTMCLKNKADYSLEPTPWVEIHKEARKMDDAKKCEAIGIFRYGVIAPALHMSRRERRNYFQGLAGKELDVPHYGLKRYKAETFSNWLLLYKNGGLDNLKPSIRSDKGIVRRITEEAAQHIRETIKEFPFLSSAGIYRMLLQQGKTRPDDFGETTLRNYVNNHGLRNNEENSVGRKKYEKENVNELWVADFMHGPYIQVGKRKRKTYLCAIIDDHSRVIVGAGWYLNENTSTLAQTLKNAVNVFGLPQVFYCDNGSVFVSSYLHLVCAKLGIALVHSRPYDSPSRGKIERFFRTVREKFLAAVSCTLHLTIDELDLEFNRWLDTQYHKQCHCGISERPLDRYFANAANNKIKTVPEHELDNCFLNVIHRTVKKDATVSVNKKIYEVPPAFIGKIVEMTFPLDQPDTITLIDNGKPVARIKPVNVHENANKPYTGIHFKNFIVEQGEATHD
jgi:putative transposase